MPKFRVYIAASVDGYIAEEDGSVSWLDAFDAADYGYNVFSATIATVVMGRTSFDQTLAFGTWPYAGMRSMVLTHRDPPDVSVPDCSFVSGSEETIASGLDKSGGGDVWVMGGADVIGQFLDAGRIDSLELFLMPVLLGRGIPTFPLRNRGPGRAPESADQSGGRRPGPHFPGHPPMSFPRIVRGPCLAIAAASPGPRSGSPRRLGCPC
jgi:dihydrofolate reductase